MYLISTNLENIIFLRMKIYLKIMLVLLVLVFGLHCCMSVHIIDIPTTGTHQNCLSQNVTESIKETVNRKLREVVNPYLDDKYGIMIDECGGPGWRRIAYLDMNNTDSQCPSEWRLHTDRVRGCGRTNHTGSYSCDSVYYRNNGLSNYSRVCGRITAYQKSIFFAFYSNIVRGNSIDSAYATGVLLSHGPVGSRQHIWTFVGAVFQQSSIYAASYLQLICPCAISANSWPYQVPPFVGNNYFCDSGNPGPYIGSGTLYPNDPLWDGAGCPSTSSCCEFNNPPWFNVSLPTPTTDDIEVRLCSGGDVHDTDVIVNLMEIYVSN